MLSNRETTININSEAEDTKEINESEDTKEINENNEPTKPIKENNEPTEPTEPTDTTDSKELNTLDSQHNELSGLEYSADWTFNKYTKAQLNIIHYVLSNSQLFIPYFVPYDAEKGTKGTITTIDSKAPLIRNKFLYGFNELSNQFHRLYVNGNYIPLNEFGYIDIGILVNTILDAGKNIYTNNMSRAELHQQIYSQRTLTREAEQEINKGYVKLTDIDYLLSKIHNLPVSLKPKCMDDMKALNYRAALFASYAAHFLTHQCHPFFAKNNAQVGLQKHIPYSVKQKYKVISVPRELQRKFNKIYKYFDELIKMLKYNEERGFWMYVQDGVELPIICQHEYMILSGKPLAEVSIKCYLDGACKYCGAEMNAYHEVAKQELPVKVYDLIYKYMACINENIDESLMMFAIFDLLYNSVKKNVDSANPTNYDESVVAFSGLYLYALYLNTKDSISYSPTKFNKFLDSAKKYWTEIGWTARNIEQSLNTSMFSDLKDSNNATNILKQFIYTNKITFLDVLPLSILFKGEIDPKDINTLKATTPAQQLFITGKMKEFNNKINEAIAKLWQLPIVSTLVSKYPTIKYEEFIESIDKVKTNRGEKFFKEACLTYCPANDSHMWTNNTCKHCGLNKDKNNWKKVYDEYVNVINNNYLQEPRLLDSKKLILQPVYTIHEIELMKPEDLYEKYLKIDSYVLKQAIDKNINELTNFEELHVLLKTLLTIDGKDIKKDAKFVKQCLCFIVQNGIKEPDALISELENVYFKIENIEWLTI